MKYSLELCGDINQLNEYLPLYAFINTHSTMDVSVQDMRMALWFLNMRSGQAGKIASVRMRPVHRQNVLITLPPFTKALFTYVKGGSTPLRAPGHMGGTAYQKARLAVCFA
ncbi:hypothetical protein O5558_20310 [Escherichia coli]|nr:hypothetical protein [Escherichia coli]